jgi:hypothetical protein
MLDAREYYWQTAHALHQLTVIMDCNDQFLAEYHPIAPSLENLDFLGPDNCTEKPGNLHHNCQCYLQVQHLSVAMNYTDDSQLRAADVTDCHLSNLETCPFNIPADQTKSYKFLDRTQDFEQLISTVCKEQERKSPIFVVSADTDLTFVLDC